LTHTQSETRIADLDLIADMQRHLAVDPGTVDARSILTAQIANVRGTGAKLDCRVMTRNVTVIQVDLIAHPTSNVHPVILDRILPACSLKNETCRHFYLLLFCLLNQRLCQIDRADVAHLTDAILSIEESGKAERDA
jgi:hypothetical protein